MSRALIYRVPGERVRCPACASPRLRELDLLPVRRPGGRRQTGFVTGCDDCGLVFSNPLPTAEELSHFYSPSGEWRASRTERTVEAPEESAEKRGRSWTKPFNPIRRELRVWAPPPGAKVLDFGCGTGKLLDAFQDHGWETWGIETAVDDAFRRHRRLEHVADGPVFDLIVVNHVLEHVADPLALLRTFARASRMGGYLFVGVPRLDTLPIHRDYTYVINGRAHVMAYTWTCLQGLLARAGWAPVEPPPDRVAKGQGRTTCARLRVVARRVNADPVLPKTPLEPAREALRQYYRGAGDRSILARLRLYRLAARTMEAGRRRRSTVEKSPKRRATVS